MSKTKLSQRDIEKIDEFNKLIKVIREAKIPSEDRLNIMSALSDYISSNSRRIKELFS